METVVALCIGSMVACGVWLVLRPTVFSAVLGLTLLSYGVNLLIFVGGRLGATAPPLAGADAGDIADPLPQALVLTAIVIGFGMTAYLVALGLRGIGERGNDRIDDSGADR